MDSLTQIVLGGAVGAAVGGKKYGRKSVLIGAICGTIPDLDTLAFIGSDPVTSMTAHRGFSHSILFAFLATPFITFLFSKLKWFKTSFKDPHLWGIIFLGLLTHMLLDALTIYGTQLLWPLPTPPVGVGSIFIIDPLYTLPLMAALIWFLMKKKTRAVNIMLVVSTLYLLWGVTAQNYIYKQIPDAYKAKNTLVQTTPFNTFLWRVVVMEENQYNVGYASIFDKDKTINFEAFPTQPALLSPIKNAHSVQRLDWFTKGFYKTDLKDNKVVITDLRMGLEPENYIFGFIVGEKVNDKIIAIENQRHQNPRSMGQLSKIWDRIWNENTQL